MRTYAVGDIHGCLDELACLIDALPLEPADRLVFLGDYVDRGPDSRGVVTYLTALQKNARQEVVCLKGNHEDMLLSYLGLPGGHGDMFLFNGGDATLASYGVSQRNRSPEDFLSMIPESHLAFFKGLLPYYLIEPFLCVHGGIQPWKALADQVEEEMLWIRDQFIESPHCLPYTVIFGHTPLRDVLFDLPYKIGLDTGLVYGNTLSCLEIHDKTLFQIKRGGTKVTKKTVREKWRQLPRLAAR